MPHMTLKRKKLFLTRCEPELKKPFAQAKKKKGWKV